MQVLKQQPVREVTRRYGKVVDGIYRDVVAPFGCQRRDYLLACGFSNSIEKYGVKSRAIAALENSRRGFRLSMSGGSHEFEILVDGGTAKLGLVSGPRTTKQLLASGSASASDTWTRFAEIIKAKEASDANDHQRPCRALWLSAGLLLQLLPVQ